MDLESDCIVIISTLASNSLDCLEIGRVVEDCKEYMAAISSISFRHIYREANDVGNRLAHLTRRSYIDDFWVEETPSIIEDVINKDICKCIQGVGAMSPLLYDLVIINK